MALSRFKVLDIRLERPEDYSDIHRLIQSAFADKDYSSGTEGPIVEALRRDGDLTLSLVAKRSSHLVGHIAFSPVTIDGQGDNIFALGPVAADPTLRFQGIGSALIKEGLARLREMGARACVLIGDPNYYHRFGFIGDCGLTYGRLAPSKIQSLLWQGNPPKGEIIYASGFSTGANHP